jgi:hypothetical protein
VLSQSSSAGAGCAPSRSKLWANARFKEGIQKD